MVAVLLVIAFVFVLDYMVLRIRVLHATATVPFEHLVRNRLLAIKVKNGTYQYELDEAHPYRSDHLRPCTFPALRRSALLVSEAPPEPAHPN